MTKIGTTTFNIYIGIICIVSTSVVMSQPISFLPKSLITTERGSQKWTISTADGCKVIIVDFIQDGLAEWSGRCEQGLASGSGNLTKVERFAGNKIELTYIEGAIANAGAVDGQQYKYGNEFRTEYKGIGKEENPSEWRGVALASVPPKMLEQIGRIPQLYARLQSETGFKSAGGATKTPGGNTGSSDSASSNCLTLRNLPLKKDDPSYDSKARYEVKNTCNYEVTVYIHGTAKSGFPADPYWTGGGTLLLNTLLPTGDKGPTSFPFQSPRYTAGPEWHIPILPPASVRQIEMTGPSSAVGVAWEHKYRVFECKTRIKTERGEVTQKMYVDNNGEGALCYPLGTNRY